MCYVSHCIPFVYVCVCSYVCEDMHVHKNNNRPASLAGMQDYEIVRVSVYILFDL